jgi:hypothetical protein
MTLIADTRDIHTLARRKQTLERSVHRLGEFESRQNMLRSWVDRFEQLVKTFRLFTLRGISTGEAQGLGPTIEMLAVAHAAFVEDLESVLQLNPDIANRLSKHWQGLQHRLNAGWKAYLEEKTPPRNDEVLVVLGRLPAFRDAIDEMRALYRELETLYPPHLPQKEGELDQVGNIVDAIQEIWNGLAAENTSEPVLAFLREAGSQGAPLTLLTDEVRQWLETNALLNSFLVRLTA